MKTVTILRGISGAGKSTFISRNLIGATVCSADHFFQKLDGHYDFNPAFLKDAHAQCKQRFVDACERGDESIAVDNTNTRRWEFLDYVDVARQHGYKITVIRLICDPKIAAERNVHTVPLKSVQTMADRFENYDGEIILENPNTRFL